MNNQKRTELQGLLVKITPLTEDEWNVLLEGIIDLSTENPQKTHELYKAAYGKVQNWKQLSEIADGVANRLRDKLWGTELCREAVAKAETSQQYCIMGEIISHRDGLNGNAWAKDVFQMALQKAETYQQTKSIKDSMEECLGE